MRAQAGMAMVLCSAIASSAAQEAGIRPEVAVEQKALAGRINALAAKLARSPVAATGNLCFSPPAVAATLVMLRPGMKDPVRTRIDGALLAEGEALGEHLDSALASLRALSADIGARRAIELRHRQLAWFDAAVQFDPQWLAALATLEVPLEPFLHDDRLDALPDRMRAAVAAAVGDDAAAALQMQGLRPDTRLVLVDALHLRARWREDFVGANGSGVGEFAVSPRQRIKVTYLKRDAQLPYGKVGDDQVVRLELLAAGLVVDFALPPADGDAEALPAALQNLLEGDWGAATPRLRRRQVELKVPSFEFARTLSLEELTGGCGCGKPELRIAKAGDDDFGIVGDLTTRFSIGKYGIGATSVSEMYAWGPGTAEPRILYLTFDRPFAFAARDTVSGLVLVCGIVREPPAMRRDEPEERDR